MKHRQPTPIEDYHQQLKDLEGRNVDPQPPKISWARWSARIALLLVFLALVGFVFYYGIMDWSK